MKFCQLTPYPTESSPESPGPPLMVGRSLVHHRLERLESKTDDLIDSVGEVKTGLSDLQSQLTDTLNVLRWGGAVVFVLWLTLRLIETFAL